MVIGTSSQNHLKFRIPPISHHHRAENYNFRFSGTQLILPRFVGGTRQVQVSLITGVYVQEETASLRRWRKTHMHPGLLQVDQISNQRSGTELIFSN